MSTSYKLFQGPSRKELLCAIDKKNVTYFRGRDEDGRSHLFEVFVTGIDLIDTGRDGGNWSARGIIVSKDGRRADPPKKYRVRYSSHFRQGEFEEIARVEDYSLKYFQCMDDDQLALEIKKYQDNMPRDVRRLEVFASGLSNHERTALLAFHTHLLSDACIVPMVHYELAATVKKIRVERSGSPAYV